MIDNNFLINYYVLHQITNGNDPYHLAPIEDGQMAHTFFTHQRHTVLNRVLWTDIQDVLLHNVSHTYAR